MWSHFVIESPDLRIFPTFPMFSPCLWQEVDSHFNFKLITAWLREENSAICPWYPPGTYFNIYSKARKNNTEFYRETSRSNTDPLIKWCRYRGPWGSSTTKLTLGSCSSNELDDKLQLLLIILQSHDQLHQWDWDPHPLWPSRTAARPLAHPCPLPEKIPHQHPSGNPNVHSRASPQGQSPIGQEIEWWANQGGCFIVLGVWRAEDLLLGPGVLLAFEWSINIIDGKSRVK